MSERRPPRFWFEPHPYYGGPPIALVCGHHAKSGRFIPKNVPLTSRVSRPKKPRYTKMVGDPSRDELEIYRMHLAQKRERDR